MMGTVVTVGIGQVCSQILDLAQSYNAAREAVYILTKAVAVICQLRNLIFIVYLGKQNAVSKVGKTFCLPSFPQTVFCLFYK